MRLLLLSLLLIAISGTDGSCTFRSAKWKKGPLKVSPGSSRQPGKVLVDWSSLITNKECVDQYTVWVWKDGQVKSQGRKFIVSDKNTLNKLVDIEPCLNHHILVELKSGKATEEASYNSASVPALTKASLSKFMTVGYHRDSSGVSDVRKASIKISRDFLSFSDCIKHIEVSGTQKTSPVTKTSSPARPLTGRNPFGLGRQPGQSGVQGQRSWGHLARTRERFPGPPVVTSTTSRPPITSTARWGYKAPKGTPKPTSARGGWGYRETKTELVRTSNTNLDSSLTPSPFDGTFLRMKTVAAKGAKVTPVVKVSPPFSGSEVEMVVPVEACQQYVFDLKIISPNNGVVGTLTDIPLPRLPNIPDFVPPLMTSVLDVKFLMGGSHDLTVRSNSPVPDSCLLDYLEAVDAFNQRMEVIANEREEANSEVKSVQDGVQDEVEMTQSESLHQFGCVCSSPRLEVEGGGEVAGVYLYQGLTNGRPAFRLDLQERSRPPVQPALNRRKRFIGRVDGGGQSSTTTARNWMNPGGGRSSSVPPWREYFGITTTQSPYRPPSSSSQTSKSLDCPSSSTNLLARTGEHQAGTVTSWEECSRRCSEKASCQYWVWSTQRTGSSGGCTLMDSFSTKIYDPKTVAGRWDCKQQSSSRPSSPSAGGSRPGSRPSSPSSRGSRPGSRPSSPSSGGGRPSSPSFGGSRPVSVPQPPARTAYIIYWEPKAKQWVVSSQVGSTSFKVKSSTNSGSKCPADQEGETWSLTGGGSVRVKCSPGY